MKRILLVIYPTFSEFEITVATAILRKKYEILTVASTKEAVIGESGLKVVPNLDYSEILLHDYEAIIIPGGDLYYIKDETNLFKFVKEFHSKEKIIAAICSGPYVLGRAGVLNEGEYTATLTQKQRAFLGCFIESGYVYEDLVQHKNVLTAQGHSFVDFAIRLGVLLGISSDHVNKFYKGIGNSMMRDSISDE